MFKEFRPSLLFLVRFLGIYLAGNIIYGVYIESRGNYPDAITHFVTKQVSFFLSIAGYPASAAASEQGPTVFIETPEKISLSMYEGCNGINVMILFVAFIVAFGGPLRKMSWFIPLGLLVIHSFNLLRITLLFFVAEYRSEYFYYVHKYFFTAILYLVVFIMWVIWVIRFNVRFKKDSGEGKATDG